MRLGLLTSAWAATPFEGRAGLEQTREIGFDTIDVVADPLDLDDTELRRLLADVEAVGLPVASVLLIALGLTDFNRSVRRFHVDRGKRHVDLARDLGATIVVIGLGEYLFQHEVIPPEAQWRWAVEGVRELAEYGAERSVGMAVEIESCDLSLVNSVLKLRKFIEDVAHPGARANIDCSHLWLRKIDPDDVAKLAGQIAHTHFSDCNGETHGDLPPGHGNTPLREYLAALRDAGFDGVVSVELEFAPQPELMVEWVREAYTETARMMRELGVRDGG